MDIRCGFTGWRKWQEDNRYHYKVTEDGTNDNQRVSICSIVRIVGEN